jgi:inner membrane protein
MFNSTHTFVGFAVARTGLDKWVPRAALTAVIAANLPDIDIIADLKGMPSYLEYHRGITHSIVGIPLLSLILAAVMFVFTQHFWRTFVVALLAMATHPILDFSNPYGLRPFLPFQGTWYYGDTVFIIDPIMDLVLLLGIIGGAVFEKARRTLSFAAMILVLVYIGVRVNLRNDAEARLDTFKAEISDIQKSAVLPRWMALRTWDGIVETDESLVKVNIDTTSGVVREVARIPKTHLTPIIAKAAEAPSASALLAFARFPVSRIQHIESGYRVTFMDFRFYNEASQTSFASHVQIDHSMKIVQDSLRFNESID